MRARQLGITVGVGTTGEFNAITDVPGVRVGHSTLISIATDGKQIRTGVTVVQPRAGEARPILASRDYMCSMATETRRVWNGFARLAC